MMTSVTGTKYLNKPPRPRACCSLFCSPSRRGGVAGVAAHVAAVIYLNIYCKKWQVTQVPLFILLISTLSGTRYPPAPHLAPRCWPEASLHTASIIKPKVTFNVNEQLFAIGFKFKVLNKSWSHQSRRWHRWHQDDVQRQQIPGQ